MTVTPTLPPSLPLQSRAELQQVPSPSKGRSARRLAALLASSAGSHQALKSCRQRTASCPHMCLVLLGSVDRQLPASSP